MHIFLQGYVQSYECLYNARDHKDFAYRPFLTYADTYLKILIRINTLMHFFF